MKAKTWFERTPTESDQTGLTLIETMLACIMLSLIIVSVLGLLGSLLVASTKTSDSTAGVFVAQYVLDKCTSAGPPSPTGGSEEGTRKLLTHELDHPLDFHYRADWRLIGEPGSYLDAQGRRQTNQFAKALYHVRVTVWWMVEDAEDMRLEGGGRRSVLLERVIEFEPK